MLGTHRITLQQRANAEEMDDEMKYLQTMMEQNKQQKDNLFKQGNAAISARATMRDLEQDIKVNMSMASKTQYDISDN